jgi:putative transposase
MIRRLAVLDADGRLTTEHVRLMAECSGRSERTIWRWAAAARENRAPTQRDAFRVDDELRVLLAYCRGNVAQLRRDLLDDAEDPGAVPSLATFYRAVNRDVVPGDLAGLRHGERARREHDVYLTRPREHRNAAWEGDHVQAPVEVVVGGQLVKPWVTWFIDTATHTIPGVAITAGHPNREAIVVALRASILTIEPYGPVGGLPELVRIDRGKDFLSNTIKYALGQFAVPIADLPGYSPYLKGSIEELNLHAEKDLFARLPRYTHRQTQLSNRPVDPHQPALEFPAFVEEVLTWVRKRNTAHRPRDLEGRSPQEAWLADPTPIDVPPPEQLRLMTLEDDGLDRVLTSRGIQWNNGRYVGRWMNGRTDARQRVRIRHMPHHTDEIEVFVAGTGRYLGPAQLVDRASSELVGEVLRGRARAARQLQRDLKKAEKLRRVRYAAVSVPEPAKPLTTMSHEQAQREADGYAAADMAGHLRPDLIPHTATPAAWVTPQQRRAKEEQ